MGHWIWRMAGQLYVLSGRFLVNHPDSIYQMLADDVIYPYNEYLLMITEHGLAGWLFLFFFFYEICKNGTVVENNYLIPSLMVFLIFCFFSYPMHLFRLQVLFICLLASLERPCNCYVSLPTWIICIPLLVSVLSFIYIERVFRMEHHCTRILVITWNCWNIMLK